MNGPVRAALARGNGPVRATLGRGNGPVRAALRRLVRWLPPQARVAVARGLWWARARLGQPVLPVPRGATGRDDRPGVLVVALTLDGHEVGHLADAVARAQRRTGARAMLVIDSDAFAHLRAHDLPFEYVPPRADWETHVAAGPYDRFLAGRLSAVLAAYRPDRVIEASAFLRLPPAALDALLS